MERCPHCAGELEVLEHVELTLWADDPVLIILRICGACGYTDRRDTHLSPA